MKPRICASLLLLMLWSGRGSAQDVAEPPHVLCGVAWAWFVCRPGADVVTVAAANLPFWSWTAYLAKPPPEETYTLAWDHPRSAQTVAQNRSLIGGSERWLTHRAEVYPTKLFAIDGRGIGPQCFASPLLLPALSVVVPDPNVNTARDQPPWRRWLGTELFQVGEASFLLLAPDTLAYLIARPPADLSLRPEVGELLLPLRLGGNPFLSDATTLAHPFLASACLLQDRALVAATDGRVATLAVGDKPRWLSVRKCFAQAPLLFRTTTSGVAAAVAATPAGDSLEIHESGDTEAWARHGTLSKGKTAEVVFASQCYLVAHNEPEAQQGYDIWQRAGATGAWQQRRRRMLDPRCVLVDIGVQKERPLALVGTPTRQQNGTPALDIELQVWSVAPTERAMPPGVR